MPLLPWIAVAAALLAVLLAVSLAVLGRAWRARVRAPAPLPTEWAVTARPVFDADERRVYVLLREALPHHVILSRLPLVRFCRPTDRQAARRWHDLLGASHVAFAVCSANGRVLAAIDLDTDRDAARRPAQIKQAVLAACRVRYLCCPAAQLPSIAELQLLVPQGADKPRSPQAAPEERTPLRRAARRSLWPEPPLRRGALWPEPPLPRGSLFDPDAPAAGRANHPSPARH